MRGMWRRACGRVEPGRGVFAAAAASVGGRPQPAPAPPSAPPPPSRAGVGYVLSHEQFTTAQLLDQAAAAEQAGFAYVWASDHLQPWQDNEGHAMFPWLTLALLSQRTT